MTKELEQKLYDRFKWIRPDLPETVSLMCYGFACEDGWFDLIWELCEQIESIEHLKDESVDETAKRLLLGEDHLNLFQVKEKFGELRFYLDGAKNPGLSELISKYEEDSLTICEKCGQPGERETVNNFIQVLCKKCYKNKKKR